MARRLSLKLSLAAGLTLAVVLVAAMAVVTYRSIVDLILGERRVAHTHEVISTAVSPRDLRAAIVQNLAKQRK